MTARRLTAGAIEACHTLFIPYALFAWVWPAPPWLIAHLIFVPLLILQWRLNRDTCVLTNMVSWLRTGRWWDESDAAQGSWLASLIERVTGIALTARQIGWLTYGLLALSWSLSALRLNGVF